MQARPGVKSLELTTKNILVCTFSRKNPAFPAKHILKSLHYAPYRQYKQVQFSYMLLCLQESPAFGKDSVLLEYWNRIRSHRL